GDPPADPRPVRARRLALLLHRAAVGRWDSGSGRDAHDAGARPVGGVQRAGSARNVRRLPDVKSFTTEGRVLCVLRGRELRTMSSVTAGPIVSFSPSATAASST